MINQVPCEALHLQDPCKSCFTDFKRHRCSHFTSSESRVHPTADGKSWVIGSVSSPLMADNIMVCFLINDILSFVKYGHPVLKIAWSSQASFLPQRRSQGWEAEWCPWDDEAEAGFGPGSELTPGGCALTTLCVPREEEAGLREVRPTVLHPCLTMATGRAPLRDETS